jgi:S-adenosylmethionine uptake transporter
LTAAGLIVGAALLFALMGVLVKLVSPHYHAGEIVFYRCLVGIVVIGALVRARGGSLRTPVPAMHFWRSASGVAALTLWFYSLGGLPLATAMTLNYMSSVWMALFLIGGSVLMGTARVEGGLVAAVLVGFAGVALVLQPTVQTQQAWHGLAGLLSGVLAALAYLQVSALGRAGEPEDRVVFYFSLGGLLLGAATMVVNGASGHTLPGLLQLLAIGVLAAVAQMMMTHAYAIGHTLVNAALNYTGIVFGFGFGALWFGELLNGWTLLGIGLIVGAGLAAVRVRARAAPMRETMSGEP